ncbi:MAG: universal stress protein [Planctomycetes bacterium]|nr:universal stress protein [Planctomycetota bacterium]
MTDAEHAVRWDHAKWRTVPAVTPAELPGFRGRAVRLSRYGGLASASRFRKTGFFRTERRGGRWWLVDPEGCPFLSIGMCSVNLSMFKKGAAEARFGGRIDWARAAAAMLRNDGFNTLGRWSDIETFSKLEQPMVYTTSLSFVGGYARKRPGRNGRPGFPGGCVPVFDADFETFCDRYAARLAGTKDDPWLLGHFTDNEIPLRPDALDAYLRLPATDPGHRAAARFLASRRKSLAQATAADRADFLTVVADRCYSTIARAIRRHDPNHLVLGSRLNGRNINDAVLRGSRSLDVVSINYYHRWTPTQAELDRAAALSGRPVLVSEWYANVGSANAGFLVKTQRDRGLFYANFTLGLLKNRSCVGWHWFKYGTYVDEGFRAYRDLADLARQVNRQAYALAEYYLR